jgi:hypothetical protein
MVPFEFASILLLVLMIGVVLMSKKRKLSKMNNILNEIGIENLSVILLYWVLDLYRNAIIVFIIRNYVECVNLLFVAFQPTINAQGQVLFSMAVTVASCGISDTGFDL